MATGAWSQPKQLKKISAEAITKTFIARNIKFISECETSSNSTSLLQDKLPMFQKIISDIRHWWTIVTCSSKAFENLMQEAIEDGVEKYCDDENPCEYILHILMKLMLLQDVFLDRDYRIGTTCLIPSRYEPIVSYLIRCAIFPMKKLVIYGPLYPHITEAILKNSDRLESLILSHYVVTNDILHCIGQYCRRLKYLVVYHYNAKAALSRAALIKLFFFQSSEDELKNNCEQVENSVVSFPELQTLDVIGLELSEFHKDLCNWIFSTYKDLHYLTIDWRYNILPVYYNDTNYLFQLLVKMIKGGNILQLKDFLITPKDSILDLTPFNIELIAKALPNIQRLFLLNTKKNFSSNDYQRGAKRLEQFVKSLKNLNYLYLKCFLRKKVISLAYSLLLAVGGQIEIITVDWDSESESSCLLDVIRRICSSCSSLVTLKLLFHSRCDVDYSLIEHEKHKIRFNTLKELWIHEKNPDFPGETLTSSWISFILFLIDACPMLDVLSLTINYSTLLIFKNVLISSVTVLHINIRDAFENDIESEILITLIRRFPNLQRLYLDELEAEDFWYLKSLFKNSALRIFWGNLNGWPRT